MRAVSSGTSFPVTGCGWVVRPSQWVTHQESGGLFGGMSVGFERYGERGEVVGNLAGDARAAFGGVEL